MLNKIKLENFKSIESAEIPLDRVTVFVGPNNAGKSSVLQGVQFAVSAAQSLKLDGVSRWKNDSISGTLSTEQLIYTPLRDVQALATGGRLTQVADYAIRVGFETDNGNLQLAVSKGKNKNIRVRMTGQQLGAQLEDYDAPYSVVAPGLAGIPAFEEYKSPGLVRRAAAKGDANSVFRNVLHALHANRDRWSEFHDNLHHIFPEIDIEIEFAQETDETISVYLKRDGRRLPIDSSGTGILQAVQVLAYVGLYEPRLLILDEPDSHLHPDNQRKLARLLEKLASAKDFQVLLSTHSRTFIDELHSRSAQITWFSSGAVQQSEYDHISALMDLGALDAADRLNHGVTKCVVITEDERLEPLRIVIESSGLSAADYDIWSYKGCSNTYAAVAISNFIREKTPGTYVILHRDRDYLDEAEVADFIKNVQEAGAFPFVTAGTDVEAYLLNIDHLKEIFPELSTEEIESILDEATSIAKKRSIKNFINAGVEFSNRRKRSGIADVPSAGSIAESAEAIFAADPSRYRHGKTTLKAVRRLLQERHGLNRKIERTSSALEAPMLSEFIHDHVLDSDQEID